MDEKLYKVWSSTLRKAVFASSLKDLIKRGSEKLNIGNEVLSFLEDGTELDEEKIFQALPEGTVIYLLTDNDKKPWEKAAESVEKRNESNQHPIDSCNNSNEQSFSPLKVVEVWPSSFNLPENVFSDDLKKDLNVGKLSWAAKSELLSVLSQEIRKITEEPTPYHRDIVARELIRKYPVLKSSIGEGHEGWAVKIYDRVKNDLRKKQKFNHKRKLLDPKKNVLEYPKKIFKNIPAVTENEDDSKIIEQHKEILMTEMSKTPSSRCFSTIEAALKKTYYDRRNLIRSNIPLGDLKNIYPALFTVVGINYDFNVSNKCDLQKTVLTSLHACSSAIIQFAEKKKKDLVIASNEECHINNKFIQAVLILPMLFRENPDYIYKQYAVESVLTVLEEAPVTPHLSIIGDPFTSAEMYIVAENKILVESCDFIEGISTLIGLYFVANIRYPKEANSTYKFFEAYILKFKPKSLPRKVVAFAKHLP